MALELGLTAAAAFAAAACAIPGRRGVGPRARVGRADERWTHLHTTIPI